MAGQAARPRPNKNKDGQDKKPVPTMSHDISISPGKPQPAPTPPPAPGMPAPGQTNPLTHPAHPVMQSAMGTASLAPGTPPAGPTEQPADQRQVQERIQFKDLPAPAQAQVETQQGIDPYSPVKMGQQAMEGALQKGPSQGAVPNAMQGPYLPPDVASFPDDFAHLQTLMQQGFAPGASHQEHGFALNADALHRAFASAQNGTGSPTVGPPMTPGPLGGPPTPDMGPGQAPGMPPVGPGAAAPPMGAAPAAPGAVPPELIAALINRHRQSMR